MTIIKGKRGSGKTYELLERVKRSDAKWKVILVGNGRSAEFIKNRLAEHDIVPLRDNVAVRTVAEFAKEGFWCAYGGDLSDTDVFVDDLDVYIDSQLQRARSITATATDEYFQTETVEYTPKPPTITVQLSDLKTALKALEDTYKLIVSFPSWEIRHQFVQDNYDFCMQRPNTHWTVRESERGAVKHYQSHGCTDLMVVEVI